MAQRAIFGSGGPSASRSAAGTGYGAFTGKSNTLTAFWTGTESRTEYTTKNAFDIKGLYFNVDSNTRDDTSTFTLRKNRADTGLSVTVAANTTGAFTDTDTTVSFAVDDEANYKFVTNGTAGSISLNVWTWHLETSDQVGRPFVMYSGFETNYTAASTTYYYAIGGNLSTNTTEHTHTIPVTTTFSNLGVRLNSNANTNSMTFTFRNNGADGNQSVVVPASTSGITFDTSNTDTVTAGNSAGVKLVTGAATVNFNYALIQMWAATATADRSFLHGPSYNASAPASSLQLHFNLESTLSSSSNNPRGTRLYVFFDGTFSKLGAYISANTDGTNRTWYSDKNNTQGSQSFVVTANTTGYFEDASGTDDVTAGDYYAIRPPTNAASGTGVRATNAVFTADTSGASGTASITLGALTAAGTGEVGRVGTAAITLDALTAAGTGTVAVVGTASNTLGALTSAGAGTVAVVGTAAITLADLTVAGTGTVAVAGTAAITLADLTVAGTGTVVGSITGTASITLADLTVAGTGAVFQRARPASDITVGTWTTDTGATTNLYAALDEETANDSDYIKSVLLDQGGGASGNVEVLLAALTAPSADTGHTLKVRVQHTSAAVGCDFFIELRQGATLIKQQQVGRGAGLTGVHEATINLSEAEAANITDYSDLRVRVYATGQS